MTHDHLQSKYGTPIQVTNQALSHKLNQNTTHRGSGGRKIEGSGRKRSYQSSNIPSDNEYKSEVSSMINDIRSDIMNEVKSELTQNITDNEALEFEVGWKYHF